MMTPPWLLGYALVLEWHRALFWAGLGIAPPGVALAPPRTPTRMGRPMLRLVAGRDVA
jgi:hypothetical protein